MADDLVRLRDDSKALLGDVLDLAAELRMLNDVAPDVFADLVRACREPGHTVSDRSAAWLCDPAWNLATGATGNGYVFITPLVRAVVVSAADGEGKDLRLADPWLPDEPGPVQVCACGVQRRNHGLDGTIRPSRWSDHVCDGFTPAGGEVER